MCRFEHESDDAGLPICRRFATFHAGLFSNQRSLLTGASKHSALAAHIHRIRAIAHWKVVTKAIA